MRIVYAIGGLALTSTAVFYASMWLLVRLIRVPEEGDGYGIFQLAVALALGSGVAVALLGLTLPWKRRRRRSGRSRRMTISAVIVVLTSIGFASREHDLVFDLLFAAWLAYTLAFTYVRYGVLDSARAGRSAAEPTEAMRETGE